MKVGDYVRVKDGDLSFIGKIKRIEKTNCINIIIDYSNDEDFNETDIFDWQVIKSSPNIIDLIEVGDFVNGFCVLHKENDYVRICAIAIPFDLKNNEIKSIVTKEQFKEMEYRIGDD